MNIETKWLQDFVVLSETLNFSKASKLRYVTQPAFSRRIQALENNLACQLFYRNKHPVELTPQGENFKALALQVLNDLEQGVLALKNDSAHNVQIRFATTHTLSTGIFPMVAQCLSGFVPQASTELKIADADDCIDMLLAQQCDFLLSFDDPSLNARQQESLFIDTVRLLPVCVPDERGAPRYKLSQVENAVPYLAYQSHIYLGRVVNKLIAQHHGKVNIVKRLESSMADNLKMMAIKGLGIAWIPEFSLQDVLANKQLVVCGDKQWQPELDVRIYHAKNITTSHQAVWSYLQQKLS